MSTGTMTPTEADLHELTAAALDAWTPGAPETAGTVGTTDTGLAPTRSGLSLELPPRALDEAFGRGRIVRFEEWDLPHALTHEPTRRFLRETGLPETAPGFTLDLDAPLRTPGEYIADEADTQAILPPHAARLLHLGTLPGAAHALLDGTTGKILRWTPTDGRVEVLETDIAAFAFTLWHSTHPGLPDVAGLAGV
ncbi:SUKH-4 family immunity protein [Streptomyces sp. XM83C]|jgi:hypothetical protein|nr:SUKH-4 family immunity protein [Streptomyces sp. XM83C]